MGGKSVQLDALRRQVAAAALNDIACEPVGIDEWKSRCNLTPYSGKLHLQHSPIIYYGALVEASCRNIIWHREKSVPLAALRRQVAPQACTDDCTSSKDTE